MAYICDKCGTVHPPGAVGCEDARGIRNKNVKEFNRRVRYHEKHCRGCPDPSAHVIELDRMDNLPKEPIRFA